MIEEYNISHYQAPLKNHKRFTILHVQIQMKNSTHEEYWQKTIILVFTNKSSSSFYSVGRGLMLIARFAFALSADDSTHTVLSAGSSAI